MLCFLISFSSMFSQSADFSLYHIPYPAHTHSVFYRNGSFSTADTLVLLTAANPLGTEPTMNRESIFD